MDGTLVASHLVNQVWIAVVDGRNPQFWQIWILSFRLRTLSMRRKGEWGMAWRSTTRVGHAAFMEVHRNGRSLVFGDDSLMLYFHYFLLSMHSRQVSRMRDERDYRETDGLDASIA